MKLIKHYRELYVYQNPMSLAMKIFELTKHFPSEERYNLTDQIRRSSRSICTNLSEAWRKRRYKAAFIAKLSDSETEAAETQVSAELAFLCKYWDEQTFREIDQVVNMIDHADQWLIIRRGGPDV
jgi:four helix bundle protein